MSAVHDRWEALGLAIGIVTLPIAMLSAMFVSLEGAAVVLVVGWFLLTPLFLVLGDEIASAVANRRSVGRESAAEDGAEADPRDELKRRYVRGEIGDAEFERRMQRIVEADHDAVGDSVDPGPEFDAGSGFDTETGLDVGSGLDTGSGVDEIGGERDRERSVE